VEIKKQNLGDYDYVLITLKSDKDEEIISKIKQKAKEDALKVNKKDTSGQIRGEELIRYNNLGGALAEEIVKIYLKNKSKENNIDAKIYSPPFTGHLEHRDIIVEVGGKIKTIEVRSSFQYKTTLQRIFTGAFSLLASYTASYKGEEPEKDFYIQVIHRYENPEILNKIDDEVEVFIVGGGSKDLFKKIGIKDNLKQRGANYLKINPINQTNGIDALAREILEIKTTSKENQSTL